MFYINVLLTVKNEDDVPKVRKLLAEVACLSRQEPACLRMDIYHSRADTRRFILCEHWADKAGWESHRNEPAFSEVYGPQVLPLVDREPHLSDLVA